MPTAAQIIGARLMEARERRELTREAVYDLTKERWGEGLSISKLEKWENGRNRPDAAWTARLAVLYQESLAYIFGVTDVRGDHGVQAHRLGEPPAQEGGELPSPPRQTRSRRRNAGRSDTGSKRRSS